MNRMSINYQFDPTAILDLPHWTFRLRFRVPGVIFRADVSKAAGALRGLELDIMRLQATDQRYFTHQGREFSFRVHVPDELRRAPDALQRYEADFWRIMARMYELGYREVSYEPEVPAGV